MMANPYEVHISREKGIIDMTQGIRHHTQLPIIWKNISVGSYCFFYKNFLWVVILIRRYIDSCQKVIDIVCGGTSFKRFNADSEYHFNNECLILKIYNLVQI